MSRASLALGTLALAAALPTSAGAAFTTGKCLGDPIQGQGASFAASLNQQIFIPGFGTFCADAGVTPTVTYNSTGSGSGRRVMGARTSGSPEGNNSQGLISRSLVPRFGMSEEPLTPAVQADINKGQTTLLSGTPQEIAGDEGQIRIIPAALGSVAIAVNVPDGCSIVKKDDQTVEFTGFTTGEKAQISDFPADPTDSAQRTASLNRARLQLTRAQLEEIFAGRGALDTWGELVAWINDGNGTAGQAADNRCKAFPLIRVRRLDDSGTSFVFKDYLGNVNPGEPWRTKWTNGDGTTLFPDTRAWPNSAASVAFDYNNDGDTADVVPFCGAQNAPFTTTYPATGPGDTPASAAAGTYCKEDAVPLQQTTPVVAPAGNGNDDLINQVIDRDGSIGYGDLSTARQQRGKVLERQTGADDRYWVKLQAKNLTSYVDPQKNPNNFLAEGGSQANGSSCDTADLKNLPAGNDPTLANWIDVSAVDSNQTTYGICSLTYFLAFDDYAGVYSSAPGYNAAAEERKARSVRDYLEAATSPLGQSFVGAFDYAKLPTGIQQLAFTAAQQIGYAKTAGGGGGGSTGGNTGGSTGGTGGTTNPGTTPAPIVAVSNAFTLSKPRSSKGSVLLAFQIPGAGSISVVATARIKGKRVTFATGASSRASGGTVRLTLKPSIRARAALRKGAVRVTIRSTFTPTGGTPKTTTSTLTIKKIKK